MTTPYARTVKSLSTRKAPISWPAKDADEVTDYAIDWSDRLLTDTVASSTFSLTVDAGLAIDSQSVDGSASVVWLSGGTAGSKGKIQCRIVTSAGRTFDESVVLLIKAR